MPTAEDQAPTAESPAVRDESGACRSCPISLATCEAPCVFSDVLNNVAVGMVGFDREKRQIFFVNPAATTVLGADTVKGGYDAMLALLVPDDAAGGEAVVPAVPRTIRLQDRFVGYTVYHLSERYWWAYLLDVTERLRMASIAEAASIAENTSYIFSGIRHELGNPLNSIKTTLQVLRKDFGRHSAESVMDYLDRALAEVDRADYILKALRSFNMYERPRPENVRLSVFITRLLAIIGKDFDRQEIAVETQFDLEAEWGLLDPRALQQVLVNVLTNAADALAGAPQPTILVRLLRTANRIALTIGDNGRGMTPDQRANLFKPFHTTKAKGTGLGMVISQKLMATMNGSIEVESREGVGTTVTLTLPLGVEQVG